MAAKKKTKKSRSGSSKSSAAKAMAKTPELQRRLENNLGYNPMSSRPTAYWGASS